MSLAERLADKNVGPFDPTALRAFLNKRKVSDSKLAFPPITSNQVRLLIEAIPSGKATDVDDVHECSSIADCSASNGATRQTYQHLHY